jgi:3'-phosphoadenosine 5'-phosphosulfate sulfotransferase (PAPS reductase)/FAD synthetase
VRTYHSTAPIDPRPEPLLRVLNLGAGTQSTAVALMHLDGTLPPIDAAIFADTGWEPREVYDHLSKLRARFAEARVPLVEVSADRNIRDATLDPTQSAASIPAFVENDGRAMMLPRQCTREWKVDPVRRGTLELVRQRLGIDAPTWASVPRDVYVEHVFGISRDEAVRARTPRDWRIINYYPLLELGWNRHETISYLTRLGWDAPRSACIGCPFHSDDEWRRLRDERPDEWADAVQFDRQLRTASKFAQGGSATRGQVYLHRSLLPLAEVDLSTAEDHGQASLFGGECEGMCGV